MANILLIASKGLTALPYEFNAWIEQYNSQGHKFIVGDLKMSDDIIHRTLSGLGAIENTTLYALDKVGSNRYGIKEKLYRHTYDSETKRLCIKATDDDSDVTELEVKSEADIETTEQFYEFRDRRMIKDCDVGVFVVVGEASKRIDKMMRIMSIYNKPIYLIKV